LKSGIVAEWPWKGIGSDTTDISSNAYLEASQDYVAFKQAMANEDNRLI